MFQFPAFASNPLFYSGVDTLLIMLGNLCCRTPVAKARGSFVLTLSRPLRVAALRTARRISGDGLWPCEALLRSGQKPAEQISQAFKVGFPIRRSMDQSLFAAPHGLSQRITSFIACACQGIHQMPLYHLIVLIAYAHRLVDVSKETTDRPGYLLQPSPFNNAINVFDTTFFAGTPVHSKVISLRPASRDKSDDARSGNTNSISPVRDNPKDVNNRPILEQAPFLPPVPPQSPAG
jgi:hypothetical protein